MNMLEIFVDTANSVSSENSVSQPPGTMDTMELTPFTATPPSTPSRSSIHISNITASWKGEQDKVVFRNVSFDLDSVSQHQMSIIEST